MLTMSQTERKVISDVLELDPMDLETLTERQFQDKHGTSNGYAESIVKMALGGMRMCQPSFQSDDSNYNGAGYYEVCFKSQNGFVKTFGHLSLEDGRYWLTQGSYLRGLLPDSINIGQRKDFLPMWQVKMPASCRPQRIRRVELTVQKAGM